MCFHRNIQIALFFTDLIQLFVFFLGSLMPLVLYCLLSWTTYVILRNMIVFYSPFYVTISFLCIVTLDAKSLYVFRWTVCFLLKNIPDSTLLLIFGLIICFLEVFHTVGPVLCFICFLLTWSNYTCLSRERPTFPKSLYNCKLKFFFFTDRYWSWWHVRNCASVE